MISVDAANRLRDFCNELLCSKRISSPAAIVCFGSALSDEWRQGSDIDVLLLFDDSPYGSAIVEWNMTVFDVSYSSIFHIAKRFLRNTAGLNNFFLNVLANGHVIYATDAAQDVIQEAKAIFQLGPPRCSIADAQKIRSEIHARTHNAKIRRLLSAATGAVYKSFYLNKVDQLVYFCISRLVWIDGKWSLGTAKDIALLGEPESTLLLSFADEVDISKKVQAALAIADRLENKLEALLHYTERSHQMHDNSWDHSW